MNPNIETTNQLGEQFLTFAWPVLWQSSLLITVVFALDFLLARKIRASVRYALWLAVLIKLLLPPTLALPTGAAWWLFHAKPTVKSPVVKNYTVIYDTTTSLPDYVPKSIALPAPPPPKLEGAGWTLVASITVSAGLLLWLALRWWQVARMVRRAVNSEKLLSAVEDARRLAGLRSRVQLKLVEGRMSPAVCGLFCPVILLPRALAEKLSAAQLRAVLLHEVFHLRRRDVWVNCAQALLQIVYWWHPLLWIANARIRRVREEAVDDAVMLALRDEADSYAPTLLEVAKLAFRRPLLSLGLVGIMESRSALRQRIERLVDFRAPRKAGITLASLCGICVFSAVALPMGEAPTPTNNETMPATVTASGQFTSSPLNQVDTATTAAMESRALTVKVNPETFIENVKAQAAKSMLSPTNDCAVVLDDILRSEGLDIVPPHGIAFNTKTGEITTQNTPEKLEIFRLVIEQLNRADGKCELPLRGLKFRRKMVLIEAQIYQIRAADFWGIVSGLQRYQNGDGDAWWAAEPEDFKQLNRHLESSGWQAIQRPRIQTASGRPAEFFVGTQVAGIGSKGVEFDCKPFVEDGFINLTLQGRMFDAIAEKGAFTNEFHANASALDHGGLVLRMENFGGHAASNLVVVIGVQIITNQSQFQQRLQTIIKRAAVTNSVVETQSTNLLFARSFAVDPRTFAASLKQVGASPFGSTNSPGQIAADLRKFFVGLGVDWDSPPGKSVFYKDTTGRLFVRATLQDLDIVERAIETLNSVPPQIHIKARFFEVPQGTVADFGNLLNSTNPANAAELTGIINITNLKTILRSLESHKNIKTLAEPEGTTMSGRQMQMRATQLITVVTNFAFQESVTNGPSAIFPQTGQFETGTILDVTPIVLADGYTINLTVTPSLTEFLGYANPPNVPNVVENGNRVQLPVILPHFSKRQASANLSLWDGQTAVLAGMSMKNVMKDKVPVLGDVPLMGRMFRSQHTNETEILVFVTVDIVDPAGNRVHANDEMPFAKDKIPPQPAPVK